MIFFKGTTAIKGTWIMNLLIASMLASRLKEQNKEKFRRNVKDANFWLKRKEKNRLSKNSYRKPNKRNRKKRNRRKNNVKFRIKNSSRNKKKKRKKNRKKKKSKKKNSKLGAFRRQ